MADHSAGILLFRRTSGQLEVLVVHPGGPFWAKRDQGSWSLPKGEYSEGEDPFEAACREFGEELGSEVPAGEALDLGEIRQAGGKMVSAWAVEGDLDVTTVVSNEFEMEWPPRSGTIQSFPEVDRAEWFSPTEAARRLNPAQVALLERLTEQLH